MSQKKTPHPIVTTALSALELLFQSYHEAHPQAQSSAKLLHLLASKARVYALPTNGYVAQGQAPDAFYQTETWSQLPEPIVFLHYDIRNPEHAQQEPMSHRMIIAFDLFGALIPTGFQQAVQQTHADLARYGAIGIVSMAQASGADHESCSVLPLAGMVAKKASPELAPLHMISLFQDKAQQAIDQFGQDAFLYDTSADLQFALLNLSRWLMQQQRSV